MYIHIRTHTHTHTHTRGKTHLQSARSKYIDTTHTHARTHQHTHTHTRLYVCMYVCVYLLRWCGVHFCLLYAIDTIIHIHIRKYIYDVIIIHTMSHHHTYSMSHHHTYSMSHHHTQLEIVAELLTSAPVMASGWLLDGFPRTEFQVV
jgi:hypothetical protein